MNPVLRYGAWIAIGCLFGAVPKGLPAQEKSRERPALVDYFPTAEDHGGWRSLLPEKGDPDQKQKAAIREVAGVSVSGPASGSYRLFITISPGRLSPKSPITAHNGGSTPTTRTRPVILSSVQAFATTTAKSSRVSTWCLSGSEVAISTLQTSSPIS